MKFNITEDMKMKNVKTLTAAILLGMGLLVGGCGSQQPVQHKQQVKQVCVYDKVDVGGMGSYSASQPVIDNGMTFSFNNAVNFKSKKVDIVEGKQMLYAMITKDDSLCLYEIDVAGKDGWGKLENPNNVYQVDTVERAEVLAYDLYNMGLPIDTEINKMVHVTHIKGHLVHTHTKECK